MLSLMAASSMCLIISACSALNLLLQRVWEWDGGGCCIIATWPGERVWAGSPPVGEDEYYSVISALTAQPLPNLFVTFLPLPFCINPTTAQFTSHIYFLNGPWRQEE